MSDGTEFEVDMGGNLGAVAHRFAAELAMMNARLDQMKGSLNRAEHASSSLSQSLSRSQLTRMREQAVAVERLRKGHLANAPAMRATGAALRLFGVHGATLRKFTVEAAKTEAALRRLYRVKGGGLRGAGAVAGSLASRAWNGGLRERAGSALWSGTKGAVSGAASLAMGGAAIGGAAVAGGAGLLGYSLGSAAIEAERVRYALDAVTKGKGAEWWKTASTWARDFGFNVSETARSLMKMKASGFSDEMSKDLFLRMGDLRSIGAGEGEIDRALLAIRQIKSLGKLMGEELNQLTEAGVDASFVYEALSKKLGKTVPELMKMKEAGKLTSDIVLPAISEAIGMKTGGKAAGEAGRAAAGATVTGAWGRMKGAWSVRAAESLDPKSLGGMRSGIDQFTNWLNGAGGSKAIDAFSGLIGRLFQSAPAIIDKVIWMLDVGIPSALTGFSEGFAASGADTAMGNLMTGLSSLGGEGGASAAASLRQIGADAGSLIGSLATLCGWLVKALGYLGDIGKVAGYSQWIMNPGAMVGKTVGNSILDLFGVSNKSETSSALGTPASSQTGSDRLESSMAAGIPRVESAARGAVASQIPKMAAPVVHQSNSFVIQGADASSPEAIANATNDRSERGMTSLLSQLGYNLG